MQEFSTGLNISYYDLNKVWHQYRNYPGVKGVGVNKYRVITLFVEDPETITKLAFMIDLQKRSFKKCK